MLVRLLDVRDDPPFRGSRPWIRENVVEESFTGSDIVDLLLIYFPPCLEFYNSGELLVKYEYEVCIADWGFF